MDDEYSLNFQECSFTDVDINQAFGVSRGVVPVGFLGEGSKFLLLATAFCITAPFKSGDIVFATAKHVFTDVIDGLKVQPFIALPRSPDDLNSLVSVPIYRASCAAQYADVALFAVNPERDSPLIEHRPARLNVNFGPPRVGEHCLALGFPQNKEGTDYRLVAADGVIEEVHERRRDSVLISYPSFRVGARYASAVSGGPILGEDGRVIGVVSTGVDIENSEQGFSYGATIGSILELELDLYADSGDLASCPVPHLANMGLIGDRTDPVITLNRTEGGVTLTWTPTIES